MNPHIVLIAGLAACALPAAASAQTYGSDAAACNSKEGPALQVNIEGLKDRAGEVRVELYPANATDFLSDDHELVRQGKTFRRVRMPPPATSYAMCIRVPKPGHYSLIVSHNREGKDKFNFRSDGAGGPKDIRMGYHQPRYDAATVDAGPGITQVTVRMQYFHLFGGFGPLGN